MLQLLSNALWMNEHLLWIIQLIEYHPNTNNASHLLVEEGTQTERNISFIGIIIFFEENWSLLVLSS
jgi:hypothetical protein